MHRPWLPLALALLVVSPAFAFRENRAPAHRIAIVSAPGIDGEYETRASARVRKQLVSELRDRGYDAVDSRMTIDEIRRSDQYDADLFVELTPAESSARQIAEAGVEVPNGVVDIAVIVSRIAADLRIYDGRTLQLIARRDLRHQNVTVAPTGGAIGTFRAAVEFALPFVEMLRFRQAVNSVVDDAVEQITAVAR